MIFGICFTIVIITILIVYALIINDVGKGVYNVKDNVSVLSKEAEKKYTSEYPTQTIDDLKLEIEKIADMLIDSDKSNRYTELLRQKAKKDEKLKQLKHTPLQKVELIKYVEGTLKSKLTYKDQSTTYHLILTLTPVTSGRVFLTTYYLYKTPTPQESYQ
jgi:hypothetical protein